MLLLLLAVEASAFNISKIEGNLYARFPGSKDFLLATDTQAIVHGTILLAIPDVNHPVASNTFLVIGSHSVTLFPGALVRLLPRGLYHLAGRIELNSEQSWQPLLIFAAKFYLQYGSGNLLSEVTPDSGTYVAMRGKGDAFIKDQNRKIIELEADQEVFFPLFGQVKIQGRLSSFWDGAPTGFAAARLLLTPVKPAAADKVSNEVDGEIEISEDSGESEK